MVSAVEGSAGRISGTARSADNPAANSGEPVALSVLIAWAACAFALVMVFLPHPWSRLAPDPDSLMRLVQVRDLIGGQGWFDTMQYRLDPPGGLPMHWSRLIDAPLATIIMAGTALFGQSTGEAIALFFWPLALLGVFTLAATVSATAIAGRQAAFPAAILAILCLDTLIYFIPGRIDHHNVQLALVLIAVATAARIGNGARYGTGAGLTLAVMLAIGLETLPYAIIIVAGIALNWALSPTNRKATATGTIAFGLSFAGCLAILHAATIRVAGTAVCDTLSPAYLLPGMVGGIGLAMIVQSGRAWTRTRQLSALAGLAAAVMLPAALLFPQCLAGPYSAVSSELQTLWLSGVAEAQTLMGYAAVKPAEAFGKTAAPVLALIAGVTMIRGRGARPDDQRFGLWLALAAIGVALALSFAQVRAAPFANAFAIPVLAAWIGDIRSRMGQSAHRRRAGLVLIVAWLAATPLTWYGLGFGAVGLSAKISALQTSAPQASTAQSASGPASDEAEIQPVVISECADRSATVDLAFIDPGRVMSTVFYGPNILAMSAHSVVAGPYHRGESAILDTVRTMNGTLDEAKAILSRRRIDYLVICPTSAEVRDTIPEAPDGPLARLVRGDGVPWLQQVPGNSALKIFRIML
ncbi:MAG: hypothetical protein ACTSSQ_03670 [Alphaproteobacteria bacterium]